MRNLNDKIAGAPNFKYYEFVKSSSAKRFGISNTPDEEQWQRIEFLAQEILQPLREKFGPLRINSGFRSHALNKAIGGSFRSIHCIGAAADIEPIRRSISLMVILNWIIKHCNFTEMVAEYFPGGWVHIAYIKDRNEKNLKLKDETHNYKIITLDELTKIYN